LAETAARAHLNLVESSRRLFELDPGTVVEEGDGWLFGAGGLEHPVLANAAFRSGDGADPAALLARAREFFAARGRGFALWARVGVAADEDLLAAAREAGLEGVYEMPEMILSRRAEEPQLASGAELRRVESEADLLAYWDVAASAYASLGFPPELFEANRGSRRPLEDPDAAAFLALLEGEPAAVAMTIVTHGVAGVYWVGTVESARGVGLGRAVTAAATNAGLELGGEAASLQASHMGRPIYEAMGYETIHDYRLLLSHPPGP
jgi:Acetyltransferase (GNAT) domain